MNHFREIRLSSIILSFSLVGASMLFGCGSPRATSSGNTQGRGASSADLESSIVNTSADDAAARPAHPHQDIPKPEDSADPKTNDDPKTEAPGPDDPTRPDDQAELMLTGIGVRNFQQINFTMAALTGIPTTTPAIVTAFTALTTSLPTDTDVHSFVGSNQVGVFKLAVEYCDTLVKDPARRVAVFGKIAFTGTPAVALTVANKKILADALVTRFWGKDLESLPPHAESVALVSALIDQLMVGKTAATATPGIITGTCSAALASAPVSLF